MNDFYSIKIFIILFADLIVDNLIHKMYKVAFVAVLFYKSIARNKK